MEIDKNAIPFTSVIKVNIKHNKNLTISEASDPFFL
jgi:hypothetical protein